MQKAECRPRRRQQVGYNERCLPMRKQSQSVFLLLLFLYIRIISDNKSTYSSLHLKSTCRTVAHLCFRNIKHNRWVIHYLLWVVSSCTFILIVIKYSTFQTNFTKCCATKHENAIKINNENGTEHGFFCCCVLFFKVDSLLLRLGWFTVSWM